MRERQPGERLRVVIAGDIYAKRALVRRFLEDDGFDVVAEALTGPALVGLEGLADADAVVVDADLLEGSTAELRSRAPDAAIVVFTDGTGAAAPPGADAYLEKGMGLASLTALLHSLLSETPATPLGLAWAESAPQPPTERRILAGLASVAAGIVLIAVISFAVFGGAGVPVSRDVAEPTTPASPSVTGGGPTALDQARDDVRALQAAIAAGQDQLASSSLARLTGDLASAQQAGYSISGLGAYVGRLLQPVADTFAPSLLDQMGHLIHVVFDLSSGGDGSGGSTATSDTSGTGSGDTTSTGSGGGGGGGGSGGGSGGGGGGSGGGDGSGGGGDQGGGAPTTPGNGKHVGWANKPPNGGWHGDNPRAHGNGNGRGNA